MQNWLFPGPVYKSCNHPFYSLSAPLPTTPWKWMSSEVLPLQYYCMMNKQNLASVAKQMLYDKVKFTGTVQGSDYCKM